jgi:hypothetical protein
MFRLKIEPPNYHPPGPYLIAFCNSILWLLINTSGAAEQVTALLSSAKNRLPLTGIALFAKSCPVPGNFY